MPIADGQFSSPSSVVGDDGATVTWHSCCQPIVPATDLVINFALVHIDSERAQQTLAAHNQDLLHTVSHGAGVHNFETPLALDPVAPIWNHVLSAFAFVKAPKPQGFEDDLV